MTDQILLASIVYRRIEKGGPLDFLDGFDRRQTVTRSYQKENGVYVLKDFSFAYDWPMKKKRHIPAMILKPNMLAYGAYINDCLVGFFALDRRKAGNGGEYLDLAYLQVDAAWRGKGIGRDLFRLAGEKARDLGAARLYISSNPAYESQMFYKAEGCEPARFIDPESARLEPFDIPLEKLLR